MMKMVSLSENDGMEIKMRKHLTILTAAAMTAVMLTACGSGDGIVINGTTAAESGIVAGETSGEQAEGNTPEETSKTGGTKIEIVTGETTAAVESLKRGLAAYKCAGTAVKTERSGLENSTNRVGLPI